MRFTTLKKTTFSLLICLAVAGCWKSSEERAAEHFESGMALLEQGDPDRALVEFRNTVKLSENNLEARRQMAKILRANDKTIGAYRNYLRIAEQLPEDIEARVALSELAFFSQNWEEFERHSVVAVELKPERVDVRAINLGARYRNASLAEDSQAAEDLITEAEAFKAEEPENPIVRQVLIDGYVKQQKYDKALLEIDKAIEDTPDNRQLYTLKLALLGQLGREDDVEVWLREMMVKFSDDNNIKSTLLRFLVSRGKTDEAENFLREVAAGTEEKARFRAYSSLVRFLLEVKGPDAALKEIEAEIAKEDGQDNLRALRASIIYDMGDRDAAISEIQTILGAETPNLTALEKQNIQIALAKMLVSDGNDVGARKLIEETLADDPNAVSALKMQAQWLIRDDKTEEAITALRSALDQQPQDAEAMTLMAEAYRRAGNTSLMLNFMSLAVEASGDAPEQSMRYARTLLQNDKALQAENVLINALRITPGNVDVLSMLGQVYLVLEDMPRAEQVVETLRRIESPNAQANADAINVEVLARQSGTEKAIEFLEDLAQSENTNADAAKLAVLHARLKADEVDDALIYAKNLKAEDPKNPQYRTALALVYASARDFDAADTELSGLLDENPEMVAGWLQLARVRVANGNSDDAISAIDKGLQAVPDAPDLLWGKASFLQKQGNIEGAIEIYEGLYKRFSGAPVIANNLASLLSNYRDDPESLNRAEVIARRLKDSDLPAFQDTYGWILHLYGDSETAVTYLEPAAENLQNDVTVQVHLGLAYAAVGRNEDAINQLRKAVVAAGPLGTEDLLDQARAKIAELEAL